MAPGYSPLATRQQQQLTPQQLQQFMLVQQLKQSAPFLSYADFLALRGQGQQPQQQKNPLDPLADFGQKKAGSYLDELFGGGGVTEGANAVSSSAPLQSEGANALWNSTATTGPMAENAAWNAAAQEAGGGIGGPAAVPGMFDMSGIGSAGNAILPAAGVAGLYDVFKNKRTGARGIGQGALSGAAAGSYFGPWGTAIGAVLGGVGGAMQHETTRDKQKKVTKDLLSKSDDPTYQAYVRGMREQFNSAPTGKAFHGGDYGSFDEYKAAGLDAADLTGVERNLRYGPEYAALSFDQKKAFTQKNIDAGNYKSEKGGVQFVDQKKADEIWQAMKQAGFAVPTSSVPARNNGPAPANGSIMIPRVRKDSPGFKDGKRINYGR